MASPVTDLALVLTKPLAIARSSIGKKLITGLTGLGLAAFVVMHMVGNLLMFVSGDLYNAYGRFIESLGPLLWVIELGLMGFVLVHAGYGVQIFLQRRRSRSVPYATYQSRGYPSLQTPSSRTMIWTGTILGIFIVSHLFTFKYGPYYLTDLNGREVRDLARLVIEIFQNPIYTASYTAVMILLGFHLRHGLWSALQSLGVLVQPWRSLAYSASLLLAVGVAIGFVVLPLTIYFSLVI
jgi:succinate dehydrogenase / fumarate reductase cytochrome b subunit